MPHERPELSGKTTHIFAHRFVVQTPNGAVFADLTPHGADLRIGAGGAVLMVAGIFLISRF